jgi:hypothetical protein
VAEKVLVGEYLIQKKACGEKYEVVQDDKVVDDPKGGLGSESERTSLIRS